MTATINIYNQPKVVTLTLGGNTGASLMNYPVNRTDFTLVKGITNEILFFVKDTDRHPVTANALSLLGITDIRIIITDPVGDCLLLGNQSPVDTEFTTNIVTTTVTYSNNVVITSNVTSTSSTVVSNAPVTNSVITNTTVSIPTPGTGTYIVPETVDTLIVETWGPGGAGSLSPLSGAAGGAYAKKTFPVTPGDSIDYYVGNSGPVEDATFWGSASDHNAALFGAYGGACVANNVLDVSFEFGAPFGEYDVGYYGGTSITLSPYGQASAWSGGNANTNPAGINISTPEGGGMSLGPVGTSPGGGAPASNLDDADQPVIFGGPGQIRITEIVNAVLVADALANAGTISNTTTSNSSSNGVTITNSVTTTVTYTSNTISYDASVLVPAPNVDPAKGVWMLKLAAKDIAGWNTGWLRYSVVCDRLAGDQVMLYTDRNYGPYGDLQVIQGPYPMPPEATVITPDKFTNLGQSVYSGAFPGAAQVNNISGNHSAVIQMANSFVGSVTVQASLENQPSTNDSDWFVAAVTYVSANATIDTGTGSVFYAEPGVNGPAYINFQGNYMWVRFVIYAQNGDFTEVDYRND